VFGTQGEDDETPVQSVFVVRRVGWLHSPNGSASVKLDSTVEQENMQKIHSHFSSDCFNKCWTLIDKADRSPEDVEDMLLLAHASLWHWKHRADCKPLNLSIGYWQVSRVYALAGDYEMAKLFGERCLKVGQDNKLPAFYVGYAYEALTRAELLHDKADQAKRFLGKAHKELESVTNKDERQLLEADLVSLEKSVPNKAIDSDKK